jgi:hypothetical protein
MQRKEANAQKNTLLKNAQANAEGNFFKRVFFSPTQEFFLPTLLFFNKIIFVNARAHYKLDTT